MRILDYGIGGVLLGEVLLRDYRLAHYTGVDISDRSLDAARQRLTRTGFYPVTGQPAARARGVRRAAADS